MISMEKKFTSRWRTLTGIHFALSVIFFAPLMLPSVYLTNLSAKAFENAFFVLQPQLWFMDYIELTSSNDFLFGLLLPLCSVFVWSFLIGWVLAKLFEWLNPFPVLGRKVF
jgi:hypothetical protein